jgi:hypothetical protein
MMDSSKKCWECGCSVIKINLHQVKGHFIENHTCTNCGREWSIDLTTIKEVVLELAERLSRKTT